MTTLTVTTAEIVYGGTSRLLEEKEIDKKKAQKKKDLEVMNETYKYNKTIDPRGAAAMKRADIADLKSAAYTY